MPADRLWGAQTERSRHFFAIGDVRIYRWPTDVIRALGQVKLAAARANRELGVLDRPIADAIEPAAMEVIDGRWADEFPLCVFQTGSGTQTNMNANEVIANRANERAGGRRGVYAPVHPNDHVNRGQSSNDVFPSVMHLALRSRLVTTIDAAGRLEAALATRAREWQSLPIVGRTHMQDATPLMLGDVAGAWATQVHDAIRRMDDAADGLLDLALGGTAVGTGLNTHPQFAATAITELAAMTGTPVRAAPNRFAALSAHDGVEAASAALRALAIAVFKIANDIRLYASGPRAGIGELRLPENEPGSSIMPGKVNPSQCEALTMVALHVMGNDHTVAVANAQGPLQLNVYKPVMLYNALESARLLSDGCTAFTRYCVEGITANDARIAGHVNGSLMLATALNPHIGYERAAVVARLAHAEGLSLRQAAERLGITPEQFDAWVSVDRMAKGNR